MKKYLRATVAIVSLSATTLVFGCSSSPSTKEEVCASFDELGEQVLQANGFFDNLVFHRADDLADVAGRYDDGPDLSVDASALHEIADSDSTSGNELMNATAGVAALCGYPLGINSLFGDS